MAEQQARHAGFVRGFLFGYMSRKSEEAGELIGVDPETSWHIAALLGKFQATGMETGTALGLKRRGS